MEFTDQELAELALSLRIAMASGRRSMICQNVQLDIMRQVTRALNERGIDPYNYVVLEKLAKGQDVK